MHNAQKTGKVHLALDTVGAWVGMHMESVDVVMLGQTHWSRGGDKIIVKKGFDLSRIKGQVIGVYRNHPGVVYFLNQFLAKQGLELSDIKLAIQSVISAENKSYLMFNISKEILEKIIDQIPCMRAPTIVKTSDESIVSVQTVVPTSNISKTITKLKNFGTSDILVLDIKRVVV